MEIRTRKETRVGYRYNPITGTGHTYTYQVTVQYEYKILNVTLLNRGVDYVARNSGLTDDQLQRYEVTLECRGNRDDLFAGIAFATPDGAGSSGEYQDYDIPGEALTDEKFRKMITEAEKYLGYPYVWGGSSPSTSFDCSGFVSWVINHCGNGWNVGRQTIEEEDKSASQFIHAGDKEQATPFYPDHRAIKTATKCHFLNMVDEADLLALMD